MMKNLILILTVTIILFSSQKQAFSQTIIHNDEVIKNKVYLKTGIEPCLHLTFGYERKLNRTIFNKPLVPFIELNLYKKGFAIKVGEITPIVERGKFKVINNLNISTGEVSTINFDSRKFAIADEIAIGRYKTKGFIAFTIEYEKIFLSKIEHTDFYRQTYYEDAVDGWYKSPGGMFQFGIEGGRTIKEKFDLHIEFKMPFTEKLNAYAGSPAHLNIGLGYRF